MSVLLLQSLLMLGETGTRAFGVAWVVYVGSLSVLTHVLQRHLGRCAQSFLSGTDPCSPDSSWQLKLPPVGLIVDLGMEEFPAFSNGHQEEGQEVPGTNREFV